MAITFTLLGHDMRQVPAYKDKGIMEAVKRKKIYTELFCLSLKTIIKVTDH